jgi:hypothetical protein
MRIIGVGLTLGAVLLASTAVAQEVNDLAGMMRAMGGGLSGKKLAKAIEKASAYPLGSSENRVRADGPIGQKAYLSRLRCADGNAPAFDRVGNFGNGVYGYIVDGYRVTCAGAAATTVVMDMYHRHSEVAAVPGFTIIAEPAVAAPDA